MPISRATSAVRTRPTASGSRPAGSLTNPRTAARRARTQAKLLTAARVVFERDGFHAARLSDIVETAAVSIGTFYNYYTSKEEIFRALMRQVLEDLIRRSGKDQLWAKDPVTGIAQANLSYVIGYRRNAKLLSLLPQVEDEELCALRLEIRHFFETRISRAIARWQQEGNAWRDIDAVYAANALTCMVDRFVHEWVTLGLDYDEAKVIDTLNRLWVRGLGLECPPPPSARHAAAEWGAPRDRER